MKHTRLYIVRHGQVVGHEERRLNGHTDVPLTDLGRAQLDAVAENLKGAELTAVYSSDLQRARYGGEAVARMHNLNLTIDPGFKELYFGDWEGLNFQEVEERYPGILTERFKNIADHRPPAGETIRDLWNRVGTSLEKMIAVNEGGRVCLVAHSGVNRVILLQAIGGTPDMVWRIDQDYGGLSVIDYYSDSHPVVRFTNAANPATIEAENQNKA